MIPSPQRDQIKCYLYQGLLEEYMTNPQKKQNWRPKAKKYMFNCGSQEAIEYEAEVTHYFRRVFNDLERKVELKIDRSSGNVEIKVKELELKKYLESKNIRIRNLDLIPEDIPKPKEENPFKDGLKKVMGKIKFRKK